MKTLSIYCLLLLAVLILSGCASPQSFFYQPSDASQKSNPPYSLVPKLDSGTGDSDAVGQPDPLN
jgi:PBP1b-binding outer membrane lipoprotein LpoB